MNATAIITSFELQVSDVTELSSSEELSILNRVYQKVSGNRPWESLKTPASGSILSDANGSYITIPADFGYFAINNQTTDNSDSVENNASPRVIFGVDAAGNYNPYQIVNFSDRRQYKNRNGYAYLDLANGVIRFTYPPVQSLYEFDYIKVPATLTASDTPWIPTRFLDVLVFGMAIENDVLQLSPSATLAHQENTAKYTDWINDMAFWNANLQVD